ncbi:MULTISPECIES: PIN/TRAM domain-containing protein [Mammaliicoccus]|uniref:PIN/TRAM domain-containing protein n=1 Tax=Mammaliicoccus fleurettii TaxID=150056 RepID=A0ABS5MNY8_9STAP|nr:MULTISPECIES: PIN/TRAM domain-containing protein [Mammaliicoccus]MBL0847833.1 PIN/TRAM domain-containing protein [Mammaliicoccus fleurettii]MBO3063642.1 PIN/TRAM domain-containing protein [Mammaliicoccus fleurettii]MBS3672649.1 PIN/TRAM domain-containing protein [Mammaliicoccus fleurettii]MBS3697635.1 PIN/TRAM domain-containing protein [Mammaliicoccus fleurettii]MBW0765725.1 PIN/TRAM domain-containing protein [Mammaliicoccus fleurettii]
MKILKGLIILCYLVIGSSLGIMVIPELINAFSIQPEQVLTNPYIDGLIGAVAVFLLFGFLIDKIVYMADQGEKYLLKRSILEIFFATVGVMIGLMIAVMVSFILEMIGAPVLKHILPIIIAAFLCYLGFQIGLQKREEILRLFPESISNSLTRQTTSRYAKILDTSAIIDGRILDVVKCHFIDGEILVPQGVIEELQVIADAKDSVKRDKGQRGLDILNALKETDFSISIIEPTSTHKDVDALLITLAKRYQASIITTDYNLNKVCAVQGIKVLNVNDLSEAIKPVIHQGDIFDLLITKIGKEDDQGVGYLDDGTMVVIEKGREYIGKTIAVEVMSLLQTSSGRIIFAKKVS